MKPFFKITVIGVIIIFTVSSLFPTAISSITIKEEEDMSREMLTVLYKYFDIVDDPVITTYVNKIGNRILASLPKQPFKYRFYVIKDHVFNAFATPAGHIFIYSGLINAMEEEEELAGILGHEIAHVYCRHISQKIERSKKIGFATLAGVAAGILLGVGGASEAAGAVTQGSMAAGLSAELSFSREDEMQSDQLGLEFITKAGYSAGGLLKILKKMRSNSWFGSEQVPKYLMTHPAIEDRIAYIGSWLENRDQTMPPIPLVNQDEFNRVHTMVEVRLGDEQNVLNKLEADIARNPQDPLVHYRYGLILARVGKRQEAVEHMRVALTKRAFDAYIIRDLGSVYLLDGQFPQALKTLESACGMIPEDPECGFYLGRTQMEMGNFSEASDKFLKLTRQYPQFTQAYYFLGQSLGQEQKLDDAHYYLGIFYLRKRDYKNAVVQFKRALKLTQDPKRRKKLEDWLSKIEGQESKNKSISGG